MLFPFTPFVNKKMSEYGCQNGIDIKQRILTDITLTIGMPMTYLRIFLITLPFLLFSCGDIIEREAWQDGIYSLSAEDTTTLFAIYHDTYQKEFEITTPLYLIIDDRDSTTENVTVEFSLYILEGENNELSSKEIYTAHENSFTLKNTPCNIESATITSAGITLSMKRFGISETVMLHKLRDWKKHILNDSTKQQLELENSKRVFTFFPKGVNKYLMLMSDEDSTTDDFTIPVTAKRLSIIDDEYYAVQYESQYLEPLLLDKQSYHKVSFTQTEKGLRFRAYSYVDEERVFEQILLSVE